MLACCSAAATCPLVTPQRGRENRCPPGTVPADPTQASVLVLVKDGEYNTALSGVKRALHAYQGPAKLGVGQAQNSSNASSSQMQVDVRATDSATLQAANDQVLAALS